MKFRMSPPLKFSLAAVAFILAALLAVTDGSSSWRSNFAGSKVFPNLDPDAVTEMSLSSGKLQLALAKVSGVWTVKQREGHPADMSKVSNALSAMASMKSARQLDDISARELKELGIDPAEPSGPVIRLTGQGGARLAELVLGRGFFKGGGAPSPNTRPDGRYCLASGGPSGKGVPLLSTALFEWLELQPGKWLETPSFDTTKTLSLKVWTSKSGSWSMSRPTLKDRFTLDAPSKGVPAQRMVAALLSALAKPPVIDLAPEASMGLEETLSVSLALDGGSSVEMTFGAGSGKAIMKSTASGQPSKWTYETDPKFLKALATPPPLEQTP